MSLILTLSAAGCKPQVNSSGTPVTTANFTIDPAVPESEAFQLPGLLSSQAVLQQNTVLKMWGQYAVDGPIAVKINDQTFYGECKDGAFELLVKTPAASKENTVTFYSATEKKTITDVWFGEVFLCAGQSNMQFTMAGIDAPEFQQTDFTSENLRIATVPVLTVDHPVTEPYTETAAVWQNIDSGTLASASAVGYYFGVEMQKNLRCPVGIVVCAAGDTIIASWLSTEDCTETPPYLPGRNRLLGPQPRSYVQYHAASYSQLLFSLRHMVSGGKSVLSIRCVFDRDDPGLAPILSASRSPLYRH